jgi:two-component system OmpR family response regulator
MNLPEPNFDVVVLEDDDLVRDVLTDIIEAEGFAVRPATTAGDALDQIALSAGCSLLLTDIDLGPGPSGFDAARLTCR